MAIKGDFTWKGKKRKNTVIRVRNSWGGAQDGQWTSIIDLFDAAEAAQNPAPVPLETFTITTNYAFGRDPIRLMYEKVKDTIQFDSYEDT